MWLRDKQPDRFKTAGYRGEDSGGWLLLGLVFHSEARTLNDDRFRMMQQPVQDGRGNGAVIVENAGPLFERFVGRQHDGAAFVALADDLEEQIGAVLIDGQVADLVQNQNFRAEVFFEFVFEVAPFVSGAQLVDHVDSVSEENRVALQASGVAQRGG